ncbi:MAG TPA: hypothetical protein VFI48_01000 [Hyphomicrobiaceae bacterium]|nr:hypothetical protein [Hyphomicrobiaceae bacterium]
MRTLAQQDGFRLLLAMDGVRNAIYAGQAPDSYEVGKLNGLVGEIASELDAPSSICTQPLPTTTPATSNASSLPTTGIGTCWGTVSSAGPSRASCCAILIIPRDRR